MRDLEALRAALKPDDALVVGKYTLHGTDNGTAHFTYLNDVGKPRGLWTAAGALIPAQTILALLSRLAAAEADRDRLLRVVEAARPALSLLESSLRALCDLGIIWENQPLVEGVRNRDKIAAHLRAALAALEAKENADAH